MEPRWPVACRMGYGEQWYSCVNLHGGRPVPTHVHGAEGFGQHPRSRCEGRGVGSCRQGSKDALLDRREE